MSEPKKQPKKKLEKPAKIEATFSELVKMAVDGKGYKPQKRKPKSS